MRVANAKLAWAVPNNDLAIALAAPHWIGTGALVPTGAIFSIRPSRKLR